MPKRHAVGLLLSALVVTGCSAAEQAPPNGAPAAEASSTTKPAAATLEWGTTAAGAGELGKPLDITPVGVYYHKGDKRYGLAQNGTFAAVAVKVAATSEPDHVPIAANGQGFLWQHDGETLAPDAGAEEPWVGRVNTPLATDIQPGEHQVYVISFDITARGGSLVYVSPAGDQQRWKLPAKSGGQGLKRVLTALDELGIKR
ncbi:hypothetical protein ACFWYW_46515 [Nonomuraea sp. NPDC059023]|uniref:hypothetical protein n=1 Tax=unclassified Nonomuraea TaxID=2593643 RepID=UPI003675E52B